MATNGVAFAPIPVDENQAERQQQRPQAASGVFPAAQAPPTTTTTTTTTATPVVSTVTNTPVGVGYPNGFVGSETYRDGFATSICHGLFADPMDRTSCCALTCCATFLQDRNRYLVTGPLPTNLWLTRIGIGFAVMVLVPFAIGMPILVWIGGFIALGIYSTRQRRNLRVRIMQEVMQGTQLSEAQINDLQHLHWDDLFCFYPLKVHRMCGCMGNDSDRALMRTADGRFQQQDQSGDFCTAIWKSLAKICCGCCGCWCNCWGACATAQEHRELRRRLPKESFAIDYVTMQPYTDYYPAIQDLANRNDYAFSSHLATLSKLSRYILWMFAGLLALIAAILFLGGSKFPVARYIIVGATLGQALAVLYIVHWRRHRFDLSLDAAIKLFGSGFCFATAIAMLVEAITSVLGYFVFFVTLVFEITEDGPEGMPSADDENPNDIVRYMQSFAQKHILTFVCFVFFNAFVVAGLTEEMSKYFCFWMVEHPDYPDERDDDGDAAEEKGVHATAASITCGMVATAAGFACAENFLYVFGERLSLSGEIEVLLMRSCFPVHPICAAIQSIGICRRDVEKDGTQLGQAVLPAIILHGSFDFVLMLLSVVKFIHEDVPEGEETLAPTDPNAPQDLEPPSVLSLVLAISIVGAGLAYYFYMSNQQKHRLNAMMAAHDSSLALT